MVVFRRSKRGKIPTVPVSTYRKGCLCMYERGRRRWTEREEGRRWIEGGLFKKFRDVNALDQSGSYEARNARGDIGL